ncbi:AMP-binding protein, partial [Streptomyces sp. ND04-05B]|uniref:AMP-binding protein n=1 Tax=Streptomyces sp. ND04-05B TaxID=3028693 RepID=UPI0029A88440
MTPETLLDVLLDAARRAPGQVVVHVRGDGSEEVVTFRRLLDESLRVAGGFRAAGVAPGTCVPLLAERSEDFQPMFWGALAAGLVPVPLAPDARRVAPVWEHLGCPPVVVDAACADVAGELPGPVTVLRLDVLRECRTPAAPVTPAPDDLAFLQFSSGSTGTPKGVELTHATVVANLRQINAASALCEQDVLVSWMPYFHDMGLIGTHLAPLAARAGQVKIGPLSFAKNPRLWLEVADRHRATVLSAANFALALTVRRVPGHVLAGLDLSAVRLILVGAEPISATVWRDFAAAMRPARLDPRAATPVYGLAEATLAVTFPPLGEVAVPVRLERAALGRGVAVDLASGDAVEVMDVGLPVPGCSVRVTDDARRPLGDRRVGHIEVRGPQVARGYHRLPEATAQSFADGWLRTGDMGFLRDGRLCVSGRHKDVLFLNGRTFHAPDMEEVASASPGLPPGSPVVVGSTDPVTGGERVVVLVPWARPPRGATAVLDLVAQRVRTALGHDDVRVLALPPSSFPRTTSGKLQRQRMRARFEAGVYRPVASSGTPAATAATGLVPGGPAARLPSDGPGERRTPPGPEEPGSAVPRAREDVRRLVRGVWSRVLGLPEESFADRDGFRALGGTSLKAMEVLAELEEALGVTLAPSVMRHDTVAALTGRLLTEVDEVTAPHRPAPDGEPAPPPSDDASSATAVVAMACRFPGANTPEEFWELLTAGRDLVTEVPPDRWGSQVPGSTDDGPLSATSEGPERRWGAFLEDPAAFDATHFGIGGEEARTLDPQARIFLELAHEALITGWPRLAGWIEEGRERLRAQRLLGEAARAWEELHRDTGALYRGARLARAEELFGARRETEDDDDLTGPERAFLTASAVARDTERDAGARAARRTRALAVGVCVFLVLALTAGLVAWQRDRLSEEEAAKAAARRLATVAESLRATDPRTASLLGAAAWRIAPLTESRSALLGALAQPERDAFTDPQTGRDVRRFLTDQGRTLLRADGSQVTRWSVAEHRRTGSYHLPGGTEAYDIGPDARFLL